jgi:cytochrome c5
MRTNTAVLGLVVMLVVAIGLLAACGGPAPTETTEAPLEEQPTTQPMEAPQEEQPTTEPTEAPPEEQPTTEPTEAPQEEQPTARPPSGDGAALLEERCTICHGLDRTTSARKTGEQWEQTVARMIAKGAELNEDEQAILIAYLAETYGP